jgi:hypothetical protein
MHAGFGETDQAAASRGWRAHRVPGLSSRLTSWRRMRLPAVAGIVVVGFLAATGGTGAQPRPRLPSFSHVVVVVMENAEYGQIIGSKDAPYINALARRYSLATNYYGVTHPSLPNYLALTAGSTFDITSDCTSCSVNGQNIVDQLEAARISWKAYMEGMPTSCFLGDAAGRYAKEHDPFLYYNDVIHAKNRCDHVVPIPELSTDLRAHSLPRYVWITPDLCDDMHDCSVKTGDAFLASLLPPILSAIGRRGVLFLTWDEGATDAGCCGTTSGGRVATIVAGGAARLGARSRLPMSHYSLLRTIEDAWHLPELGQAASSSTRTLAPLLRS